jgi:hypothetical protein
MKKIISVVALVLFTSAFTPSVFSQNCDKFVGTWIFQSHRFVIVKAGDIYKLNYKGPNYSSQDASPCNNGQLQYEEMKLTYSSTEDKVYWDGMVFKRSGNATPQQTTTSASEKPAYDGPNNYADIKEKNVLAIPKNLRFGKNGFKRYLDSISIKVTDETKSEAHVINEVGKILVEYFDKIDTARITSERMEGVILTITLNNEYSSSGSEPNIEWNLQGKVRVEFTRQNGETLLSKSNDKLKAVTFLESFNTKNRNEAAALGWYIDRKLKKELQKYLDAFFK